MEQEIDDVEVGTRNDVGRNRTSLGLDDRPRDKTALDQSPRCAGAEMV